MDERQFYTESEATKPAMLNCPYCRTQETYDLRWMVRKKKDRIPPGADERDRAKYAKAPGLCDVIQTVFGWTDSPCSANWATTDAVEPPCAGNRGAWWQSNAMNKFSRARQRCWPRAPAESEQSGNITLPHSRLNSSGTRRGQQAAALCSTRSRPGPCVRFRSLRP